jgi:hypothetical protein
MERILVAGSTNAGKSTLGPCWVFDSLGYPAGPDLLCQAAVIGVFPILSRSHAAGHSQHQTLQ